MPKAKSTKFEPIAIVGIGCRYPGGADGPDKFWKLMTDGVDAISEIPPERWTISGFYDPKPGKAGKTYSKWGGFISQVDHFDPAPFGMTAREAKSVDPQQRLLLEASWEALEDAGIPINPARSTSMGVFVGISTLDYPILQSMGIEYAASDPYAPTGTTLSIAANRISYSFNFTGPSMIVDTACSSALVALNQACRALWSGECESAIAGGVNAILLPTAYIAFCSINMLSPTGRCMAFDARANGFVRGEGVGAVVLKPLSVAQAAGDRIYATIRGTGVNQDGRTTGMTVPSQISQQNLVQQVCRVAGVSPAAIQYMEAHGTGTPVGDPIEAAALGTVLGAGRSASDPCRVGSVKTNIGHLEAGSGMAGLIKTALTLHHGQIPPNLHFENPNPNIDFDALRLRVVKEVESYGTGPRLAGVNSFGFGGTNAFALLENAPGVLTRKSPFKIKVATVTTEPAAKPQLLVLSAKDEVALKANADRWARFFHESKVPLADICYSGGTRRSHLEERLAVVGISPEDFATQLTEFAKAEDATVLIHGRPQEKTQIVFVFSGQGPQWYAMGRELWEHEPVFRSKIEECHEALLAAGGWSLKDELLADEKKSRMTETEFAQPAITAVQIALAALWESWGIHPAAVVGHSVGEVAAAYIAGVFSLNDAMRVIYHRGRCMELAPERGKMIAAGLTSEDAAKLIAPYGDKLSLAAINSPTSVSISGDASSVEEVATQIEKRGVFMRFVPVNYAFHSSHMDPVEKNLVASLKGLRAKKARIPIYSTVTGELAKGPEFNADYWWQNVRQTVRFAPAIGKLAEAGYQMFIELAAHPVLSPSINECLGKDHTGKVVPSLRRKSPERATMLGSLGALHTLGVSVDWKQLFPEANYVPLPGYPWQKESHWHEPPTARDWRIGQSEHPILTVRHRDPGMAWQGQLDRSLVPWINDHRVQGHMVFPAAGYLELGFSSARDLHGAGMVQLEDIEFSKALFIPAGTESPAVQVVHDPKDNAFRIHSRLGLITNPWNTHAAGKHRLMLNRETPKDESREAILKRCPTLLDSKLFYEHMRNLGLHFGTEFQGVRQVWCGENESLGQIVAPEGIVAETDKYAFHPALLDACLQTGAAALLAAAGKAEKQLLLPVYMDRARLFLKPGRNLWSHVRVVRAGTHSVVFDILVTNDAEETMAEFRGLHVQAVEGMRSPARAAIEELCYEKDWQLAPLANRLALSPIADFLPDYHDLVTRFQKRMLTYGEELGLRSRFTSLTAEIERLGFSYVRRALCELGWEPRPGETITTKEFLDDLKFIPRFRHLATVLLAMHVKAGYLRHGKEKGTWVVEKTFPQGEDSAPTWVNIDEQWRHVVTCLPSLVPGLTLLDRCGRKLAGILQGLEDPIHLMVPQGSMNMLEHLYTDSVLCRPHNVVAQEIICEVAARLPEGRVLRILEIGAGTGGLTGYVLPGLPRSQTKYVFTDISNAFFSRAEQRFRDYAFVEYKVLDIEKDPLAQDFSAESFDIILASNVLHATVDLRQTLQHCRRLLTPEGLLMVLEVEISGGLLDLTFGLTEGWWRFKDHDLRLDNPLMSRDLWKTVLNETGFYDPAVLADTTNPDEVQQITLLARANRESVSATLPKEAVPADEKADVPAQTCWLILEDEGGVARKIGQRLTQRGHTCVYAKPGANFQHNGDAEFVLNPADPEHFKKLLGSLTHSQRPSSVVHCWSLDIVGDNFATSELARAESLSCYSALHLVQALTQAGFETAPQLWLITSAAQPVGANQEKLNLAQSPLIGLGRAIVNEHPPLRCRLVDLGRTPSEMEIEALVEEFFTGNDEEEEVVLRGEARYIQRIVRRNDSLAHAPNQHCPVKDTPCRLEAPRAGSIDQLRFRPIERRQPGKGEIEIEVRAAGLNFRDVMKALGIYPQDAGDAHFLGDECSGCVVAVGEGVTAFKVGDAVMAIGSGCFTSHITLSATFAILKPAALTFEEAATMLSTHMTAYYALRQLGQMKAGEKVLVHAAAGGVGLAAVQLALATGAEVFATAGNEEKRDLLRLIGVQHVMDSRTLAFADEILDITNGRGVDLVLNSIAGEAIDKSLSVLGSGGRFLEIGKRDIYANTRIGLRPFRNNLSYFAIDLSKVMDPEFIVGFLGELSELFKTGKLGPLPYRAFPMVDAVQAFRYMTQAKQIGKVVLSIHEASVPIDFSPREVPVHFKADATYLISGGVGGFGLATAQWMVEYGARHLVLASRSALPTEEAQQAIDAMEKAGARVVLAKCDVGKETDLARVLADIAQNMPPLKGIIHSAMVLDDGVINQLTGERFRKVMAPKADGAWNLHRLTRDLPLDLFVLFSSSSATIGNSGQGNYCAANVFLDTLAHHRRQLGLPALAVNWGLLSEVGVIKRDPRLADHFRRTGLEGLPTRTALDAMGMLLVNGATQTTVWNVDWNRWLQAGTRAVKSARYTQLKDDANSQQGDEDEGQHLRSALAGAGAGEAARIAQDYLRQQVSEVLRVPPAKLELDRPLNEQGMDSLMAVELMHRIESRLGVSLPPAKLMGRPTISKMSESLLEALGVKLEVVPSSSLAEESELEDKIDLEAEVRLPDSMPTGAMPIDPKRISNPQAVLVTSPLDIVGLQLITDLLGTTSARIYCLIDDSNLDEARVLLTQKLTERDAKTADLSRLIPISGKLTASQLGWSDKAFAEMAAEVDIIFHNAAQVNHIADYFTLKAVNVGGMLELIRLAAHTRFKPIHYVSSLSVIPACLKNDNHVAMETDPMESSEELIGGYGQSRWVAEKCLHLAGKQGVPFTIYRPGLMIGDSYGRISTTDDFVWRLLRTCLDLGFGPAGMFNLYLTPVDYVSRAMVYCARQMETVGQTYHAVDSKSHTLADLLAQTVAAGYPVKILPWEEWEKQLEKSSSLKDIWQILPYFMFLPGQDIEKLGTSQSTGSVDSTQLQKILAKSKITCPDLDQNLMEGYLRDLAGIGFIKAPSKR